jgi:hypothetical protein
MTNECRSSNDDKGRVIRQIVTSDLRLTGLTRRSHSLFAWHAEAWGEGGVLSFLQQPKCP